MSLKIIIVGAGEVGFHIARRLASENKDVVVIDRSAQALRRIAEHADVQAVEGSGSCPSTLRAAGVLESDILLAVTDSDETNFIACAIANALNPNITKLSRLRNEEYTEFHENVLNIGKVINPEEEVVKTIRQFMEVPGAVDISQFAGGRIKLIGVRVGDGPLVGRKLMYIRQAVGGFGLLVAAIIRGEQLTIPSGGDEIRPSDLVYFVCDDEHVYEAMALFGRRSHQVKNVLVIGGGNIGLRLARELEGSALRVRLLDRDGDRCQYLAQELDRTVVLEGDGTDQDLLLEENVGGMDMVVSLTGHEETNVLISMLAKSMGAKSVITRINKFAYLPLVRTIGIEHTVSPRLSAVNSILRYMRRGKVLTTASIRGEEAEAMEAVAQENSEVVGKSLKDLKLPKGALVLSIQRGEEVIFPTGDAVILPQDRFIILSTRKTIAKVEKALTVKLEHF